MGRMFAALVLGGGLFAIGAWYLGLDSYLPTSDNRPVETKDDGDERVKTDRTLKLGKYLYPPEPIKPREEAGPSSPTDPVVLSAFMKELDTLDVSPQVSGQLLFVGEEVAEGAAQVAGVASFIAEPFEISTILKGERDVVKLSRRLYEGQVVYANQMVALVDPSKALADLAMKRTKVVASKEEALAAKNGAQEAAIRVGTARELYGKGGISREDLGAAELTYAKMNAEAVSKSEGAKLAEVEEQLSQIHFKQHEVRNKIPVTRSLVKKVYKHRGEAVKELEPVMQLHSLDRLMAEALVDIQYLRRLEDGQLVTIEPTQDEAPARVLRGHLGAVNAVALTSDVKNPLVLSASEDRSVLVRAAYSRSPAALKEFRHPEPVRAIAVSPPGAKRNLALTGCADGSLRLWDLALNSKEPPKVKRSAHREAITSVAFSPNGEFFASAAADGTVQLWRTEGMQEVYPLDYEHGTNANHSGPITALHFTRQSRLVSASRDTVIVWALKENGVEQDYEPLVGRSGAVSQLGVSDDGRYFLFDQGKTLQMRRVADGGLVNTLQNPGGAIPFETLAVFSPDSSLLLTAGAAEGRLQLWQAPTETRRGFEVRQFATSERAPVSCAAFAPTTPLAASGTRDGQVYLWTLPSKEEVLNHPIRDVRVNLVSRSIDPATRQARIGVEVDNRGGRLMPGRPVTIVIE